MKIKKYLPFLTLVLFFIAWTILLSKITPTEIVEYLGVSNGYLIAFIVALVGGLSTVINFPYQLVIFTLGAGGLNPLLVGLCAGAGVFLGDTISYIIGYHGRHILPDRLQRIFDRFAHWCLHAPNGVVPSILFLYGALLPLPNDLIVISLAFARYPYWRVMIPLTLGNITFNTSIAVFGWYSYQ